MNDDALNFNHWVRTEDLPVPMLVSCLSATAASAEDIGAAEMIRCFGTRFVVAESAEHMDENDWPVLSWRRTSSCSMPPPAQ